MLFCNIFFINLSCLSGSLTGNVEYLFFFMFLFFFLSFCCKIIFPFVFFCLQSGFCLVHLWWMIEKRQENENICLHLCVSLLLSFVTYSRRLTFLESLFGNRFVSWLTFDCFLRWMYTIMWLIFEFHKNGFTVPRAKWFRNTRFGSRRRQTK